jgi:hypothetical protein
VIEAPRDVRQSPQTVEAHPLLARVDGLPHFPAVQEVQAFQVRCLARPVRPALFGLRRPNVLGVQYFNDVSDAAPLD